MATLVRPPAQHVRAVSGGGGGGSKDKVAQRPWWGGNKPVSPRQPRQSGGSAAGGGALDQVLGVLRRDGLERVGGAASRGATSVARCCGLVEVLPRHGEILSRAWRQFEQANLEAMDESAEWRMQYDKEVEENRQLHDELSKVKASLAGTARRLELLQKDNELQKRQAESLRQQCNCTLH